MKIFKSKAYLKLKKHLMSKGMFDECEMVMDAIQAEVNKIMKKMRLDLKKGAK